MTAMATTIAAALLIVELDSGDRAEPREVKSSNSTSGSRRGKGHANTTNSSITTIVTAT